MQILVIIQKKSKNKNKLKKNNNPKENYFKIN